jgi:Na+/melibiose symporter-like transporter
VLALPAILEWMGSSDHQSNVASMGWFCLIMFPLTVIPTLLWVPDEVHPIDPAKAKAANWAEAFRVLASNRLLGRVLASDLLSGFGTGVAGALYIFMAVYVFELRAQASLSLLFYFAAAFAAMPMWLKLAYFWGKDNALKVALVYGGLVMLALLLFATPGSSIGLWSFAIGYGIAFGAAPALLRSMMADLTDEDELKHGKKRAGIFFALLTTSNKLGAAVAVGTCFTVVEVVYGFVPGPGNSQAAIDGLLFTYCVGTSLGLMLAYLPLINYPLTRARHAEIREELSVRNLASNPG